MGRQRSALVGPGSRPVSIPDEAAFDGGNQASGVVVLPHHVRWSDPHLSYDLDDRTDRTDRTRAYEQVRREGTVEDVIRFIQVDEVIELWNELFLPAYVRVAWAAWILEHRQLDLAC